MGSQHIALNLSGTYCHKTGTRPPSCQLLENRLFMMTGIWIFTVTWNLNLIKLWEFFILVLNYYLVPLPRLVRQLRNTVQEDSDNCFTFKILFQALNRARLKKSNYYLNGHWTQKEPTKHCKISAIFIYLLGAKIADRGVTDLSPIPDPFLCPTTVFKAYCCSSM